MPVPVNSSIKEPVKVIEKQVEEKEILEKVEEIIPPVKPNGVEEQPKTEGM